jgi:hypothetical protein
MHKIAPPLPIVIESKKIRGLPEYCIYPHDYIGFFLLPLFVASGDEVLRCAGFGHFAMNDSQTYPQKMCTTEKPLTSQEVTSVLQKPGEKDAPSGLGLRARSGNSPCGLP